MIKGSVAKAAASLRRRVNVPHRLNSYKLAARVSSSFNLSRFSRRSDTCRGVRNGSGYAVVTAYFSFSSFSPPPPTFSLAWEKLASLHPVFRPTAKFMCDLFSHHSSRNVAYSFNLFFRPFLISKYSPKICLLSLFAFSVQFFSW